MKSGVKSWKKMKVDVTHVEWKKSKEDHIDRIIAHDQEEEVNSKTSKQR